MGRAPSHPPGHRFRLEGAEAFDDGLAVVVTERVRRVDRKAVDDVPEATVDHARDVL